MSCVCQIDSCGVRASSCMKKTIIMSSTKIPFVEDSNYLRDLSRISYYSKGFYGFSHQMLPFVSVYSDYAVFSNFTLAFFEDSGWYQVNYTFVNNYNQFELQWGKGMYYIVIAPLILCACNPVSIKTHTLLASFPGPTKLSIACSMEKQFFDHMRGEPWNEANKVLQTAATKYNLLTRQNKIMFLISLFCSSVA